MKTSVVSISACKSHQDARGVTAKAKLLAVLEVALVFAVMQTLLAWWSSAAILQWEKRNLGWSYVGALILVGIPAW